MNTPQAPIISSASSIKSAILVAVSACLKNRRKWSFCKCLKMFVMAARWLSASDGGERRMTTVYTGARSSAAKSTPTLDRPIVATTFLTHGGLACGTATNYEIVRQIDKFHNWARVQTVFVDDRDHSANFGVLIHSILCVEPRQHTWLFCDLHSDCTRPPASCSATES